MSKTPDVRSVDAKVKVASHLSKLPFTATDDFTANLTELSSVIILKTGASCARLGDGSAPDAKRHRTANRMLMRVCFFKHKLPPTACHESSQVNKSRLDYSSSPYRTDGTNAIGTVPPWS